MNKDLVIIGSYPSTDLSRNVLKQCILNLQNNFDILLSTHYPVDTDIQTMVNYYVYDNSNELIEGNVNPIVWFSNELFYLQVRHTKNYSYSAYSCMFNGMKVARNKYNYFYYINGDTLINEKDISKLTDLKQITLGQGKKSLFFKEFSGMVDSKIFFSDIKFFLDYIITAESKNLFINYTEHFLTPYVPYVLESFFAERIDNFASQDVFLLQQKPDDYFKNSQMDVLNSFNGKPEKRRDYTIYLIKEKNSNRIFFVYNGAPIDFREKQINIKIYDESFVINNGNYAIYREVYPQSDYIFLEVDGVSNMYSVKDILENVDSYIEFK